MHISTKEQKLRDRVIFMFNVIPQAIEVDRQAVYIDLRQKDIDRMKLSIEDVEKDLSTLIDREVKVRVIE